MIAHNARAIIIRSGIRRVTNRKVLSAPSFRVELPLSRGVIVQKKAMIPPPGSYRISGRIVLLHLVVVN